MSIDIEDLSPEDRAALLAQLTEQSRQDSAEQQANEAIDQALRASLAERGHSVGCQWEDPQGRAARAYPGRFVVQHAGHWWQATVPAVMSEPAEDNPEWALNDPEPEDEDEMPTEGEPEPEEGSA